MSGALSRINILTEQLSGDEFVPLYTETIQNEDKKCTPGDLITNWSHIDSCCPQNHHYPSNEQEVVALMKMLNTKNSSRSSFSQKARIMGACYSPLGDVFYTNNHAIHLTHSMNKIVSVDKHKKQITAQGGATLKRIYCTLDDVNLMLPCVPSVVGPTIAGSLGTGTHGSGRLVKAISGYVVAMRVVTAAGELKVLRKGGADHNISNGEEEEFSHWLCHLGVLGIITEVTLQAERKEVFHKVSQPITVDAVRHVLKERVDTNDYYRFHWIPHTKLCVETLINHVSASNDERIKGLLAPKDKLSKDKDYKRKARGLNAVLQQPFVSDQSTDLKKDNLMKTKITIDEIISKDIAEINLKSLLQAKMLETAYLSATYSPSLVNKINAIYQKLCLNDVEESYGNAMETMSMNCYFKQYTTEWAIPAEKANEAFDVTKALIHRNNLHVCFPIEFRFVDQDEATLSPSGGRLTCFVGVVMYIPLGRKAPDTDKYLALFSHEMKALGGRPHWAKYNYDMKSADAETMYGVEKWKAFNEYRKKCDPNDILMNDWYMKLLR